MAFTGGSANLRDSLSLIVHSPKNGVSPAPTHPYKLVPNVDDIDECSLRLDVALSLESLPLAFPLSLISVALPLPASSIAALISLTLIPLVTLARGLSVLPRRRGWIVI